MTSETKRRIQFYQKALPGMKERIAAAAAMLLVAMAVAVTGTYAWVTLSAAPEVQSIATTVTANGSLEIALATSKNAPAASGRGDSTAAGTAVTTANMSWGNLVNLSDPSYGLTNITLRPAALNGTTGLLTNPLYGVAYGEDGRVTKMTTEDDFAYCYYAQGGAGTQAAFLVDSKNDHPGVRAISTVTYQNLSGGTVMLELVGTARAAQNQAKNNYQVMTNADQEPGTSYISSLQGLIQAYAQSKIGSSTAKLEVTDYISDLYEMMAYMDENVMEPSGQAYLGIADMCEFVKSGNKSCGYDLDTLCAAALKKSLPDYISIASLEQYAKDRRQLKIYVDKTPSQSAQKQSMYYWKGQADGGVPVYWTDIQGIIDWMTKISTATVNGYEITTSNMINIAGGSGTKNALIKEGALVRLEQRIGQKMSPTITINVTGVPIVGSASLTANVTTSAAEPWELTADIQTTLDSGDGNYKGTDAVAEDTYAMALDFWLRTNAGSVAGTASTVTTKENEDGTTAVTTVGPELAYLTLEGHTITTAATVDVMTTDINGVEQPAYTISSGTEGSIDGYQRDGAYYFIYEGKEFPVAQIVELHPEWNLSELTYTPKKEQRTVVTGYEGVNRVWTDEQMDQFENEGGTSTTQGGGSCYIFYADNEADQKRFMELLEAMKVVFVDGTW